jgi:signal peptidase II
MFYFPIIQNAHFPSWFPIWGGEEFEFFRPVFNVADAAISTGVISLFIFQGKFFKEPAATAPESPSNPIS